MLLHVRPVSEHFDVLSFEIPHWCLVLKLFSFTSMGSARVGTQTKRFTWVTSLQTQVVPYLWHTPLKLNSLIVGADSQMIAIAFFIILRGFSTLVSLEAARRVKRLNAICLRSHLVRLPMETKNIRMLILFTRVVLNLSALLVHTE